MKTNIEISSRHFDVFELKPGIFAAIAKAGGGALANAGIIDLGDKTIVFDTFNTPQAGEDLKQAAESLTGKEVSVVINSHWHGDHIRGNQAFGDTPIVSTNKTKAYMADIHPNRIEQQKSRISGLHAHIEKMEQEQGLSLQLSFLKEIAESLPYLKLCLPTVTFEESYHFKGMDREAVLMTYGGGHSECDAFLYLPNDEILFAGDLLFVNSHPSIQLGNPEQWCTILEKMANLSFKVAVPGHGPVGEKDDLKKIKEYIKDLKQLVEADAEQQEYAIPEKYLLWNDTDIFHQNIKFLKR